MSASRASSGDRALPTAPRAPSRRPSTTRSSKAIRRSCFTRSDGRSPHSLTPAAADVGDADGGEPRSATSSAVALSSCSRVRRPRSRRPVRPSGPHQYDFGRPSDCCETKFRIISRLDRRDTEQADESPEVGEPVLRRHAVATVRLDRGVERGEPGIGGRAWPCWRPHRRRHRRRTGRGPTPPCTSSAASSTSIFASASGCAMP